MSAKSKQPDNIFDKKFTPLEGGIRDAFRRRQETLNEQERQRQKNIIDYLETKLAPQHFLKALNDAINNGKTSFTIYFNAGEELIVKSNNDYTPPPILKEHDPLVQQARQSLTDIPYIKNVVIQSNNTQYGSQKRISFKIILISPEKLLQEQQKRTTPRLAEFHELPFWIRIPISFGSWLENNESGETFYKKSLEQEGGDTSAILLIQPDDPRHSPDSEWDVRKDAQTNEWILTEKGHGAIAHTKNGGTLPAPNTQKTEPTIEKIKQDFESAAQSIHKSAPQITQLFNGDKNKLNNVLQRMDKILNGEHGVYYALGLDRRHFSFTPLIEAAHKLTQFAQHLDLHTPAHIQAQKDITPLSQEFESTLTVLETKNADALDKNDIEIRMHNTMQGLRLNLIGK